MKVVGAVILIGWAAFWLYWLLASFGVKRGAGGGWRRGAAVRLLVLLLAAVLLRTRALRGLGVDRDPWLAGVGLVVFLLGLALAVWARVHIGRNWGMPMTHKAEPELVTTGPYRTIRHPIYSGVLLALIGTAIAISLYWLVPAALLGGYFVYSAVMEERYLTERFPDAYPEYKRSTRMLIPFIL
ncbi:isoprenylcysteine carboxylmethyltransferase family protein [Kitasatospora sp. NBC_01250]|uniref:methyltransferase family protein n=1 Tax=unclassified Kitasatospora TaxID=2633591 RepID=UPI002E13FE50|nr:MULTISPECIES: isoprenylcysteine carboxylmethyltransferase family protein [unclassified Kitasatospora]WSJ65217.1 isoprenylcysteine carboxylmethyltransferase family protein [Kitasatospora sp. NBC_01302]